MNAVSIAPPAVEVSLTRTDTADPAIPLPAARTRGAAGMDVHANLPEMERARGVALAPGERALIPTGLRLALPEGYEMQLRPRSGLALSQGVTLLNAPGTIDSDYRGEVGVILINLGAEPVVIDHGARIAQMVLAPVTRCAWREVDLLDDTARGRDGFGSTGR